MSASEKASALLLGAIIILVVIPALALYGSGVNHTAPIDYTLWAVLYFVYAIGVVVA